MYIMFAILRRKKNVAMQNIVFSNAIAFRGGMIALFFLGKVDSIYIWKLKSILTIFNAKLRFSSNLTSS